MVDTVLVTGATGKTGSALARILREMGVRVRGATRSPRAVGDISFDWSDASTFEAALDGVDGVYLVAPTDTIEPLVPMQPFLEKAALRRRLVLLSSSSLPKGGLMMGKVHAWLADHSKDYSVLRPSWFMQNFLTQHLSGIRQDGAIFSATGDGRVGFIDAEDIAAVAASMLIQSDALDGAEPILTGPRTLSYDEVASSITEASGRAVRHARLTVAELAGRYEGYGLPLSYAKTLAALDDAISKGAEDRVTDEVERWTNRSPNDLRSFLATHAGMLRE
ncbi:NAD-dependent epimerase/dehydratase family protein [Pararhizobium sp. PWRC1-1]|uniref:NAD-dependent epimerase/dehydratase family protein n=1 Tax=Pararhizobium sp. PWRC1-1 TaxID=2804566 RepID=UPI003CEE05AE